MWIMPAATAKVSPAPEMPESLAALLPKIRRKPLALARNGKTAAVVMSAGQYKKIEEILSNYDGELSPAEERKIFRQIEKNRKKAPLSVEESRQLMESVLQAEAKALAKETAK